ncbi:bifunctional 5,10-methylenetetrahydrofolate dehydrogenase/5,10-methenyltetrahydrofolate cyclohydrolase [Patescibacteria group bacterium]|nr:bifunctional 5,10-methylenetetrahydrofolate dehydrogenase/5,10-methenyltetrahydrofolate cyclohydrolase [Patescibacteria group bacterium]MBU0963606.1 bifunctional 5,10-methylenetetrahydrofolate dehydrogenase/5,10-methenyltetrahydrofolate cyclohydrolase [Patescibacteria group bacterium]
MEIINGHKIALSIKQEIKQRIKKYSHQEKRPGLGIILIGDDEASHIYVDLKQKAALEVGINLVKHEFSATVAQGKVLDLIKKLNTDSDIHGIVVQFPLPRDFSKEKIITSIAPDKDVDGFHPENIESLLAGRPSIIPGLAAGIVMLIQTTGQTLIGKKALVIANSKVFSGPLGYLLEQAGVKMEACDPDKSDCQSLSREADILVAAVGQPELIKGESIKPGAIVIDVGYNRLKGKPVGDVDYKSVKDMPGWITPVPGGVGPVTVAMLLLNTLKSYERKI